MALILNIDTATERAYVSIARDNFLLHTLWSEAQKDHAAFVQAAIRQLTVFTGIHLKDIDAVAVTAGPGSYTGLRVGLSSAKGLCYALNKPLITLGTLEVLARSAVNKMLSADIVMDDDILFCPMIDARRMEVYMAIYNKFLMPMILPCVMILQENSFDIYLNKDKMLFFGSGSLKWRKICKHINASFQDISIAPGAMNDISQQYFYRKQFARLAYSEPFYLKDLYINI